MKTDIDIRNLKENEREKNNTHDEDKNDDGMKSRIVLFDDEMIQNYIRISDIIKGNTPPEQRQNFDIIEKHQFVTLIEKRVLLTNSREKHVMLFFKSYHHYTVSFNYFLFQYLLSPKLLIHHLITSYQSVLQRFLALERLGICFFDFSIRNLLLETEQFTSFIRGVQDAVVILDEAANIERNMLRALRKVENFTYMPIEIHMVVYLMNELNDHQNNNSKKPLSILDIDHVSSDFAEKISITKSNLSRLTCYERCTSALKKYINKPKTAVISEILMNNKTWPNYAVSILYLFLFQNVIKAFSLENTMINEIAELLFNNIHPELLERESLENTIEKVNEILAADKWDFVNDIPYSQIAIFQALISE